MGIRVPYQNYEMEARIFGLGEDFGLGRAQDDFSDQEDPRHFQTRFRMKGEARAFLDRAIADSDQG